MSSLNPPGTPFNAIDAYFCVPSNSQLASYWDRVEDRLTKIRHGENIAGVPTPIALFDPPLDPMALVRASASGAGFLGAAAGPAATPQSNYRFNSLYDQAAELAAGVKDLGAALLAALEKRDATALDVLRNTQETAILNLTTTIKQQQIGELETTVASLGTGRFLHKWWPGPIPQIRFYRIERAAEVQATDCDEEGVGRRRQGQK